MGNKIPLFPQQNSASCIMKPFFWGILITLHILLESAGDSIGKAFIGINLIGRFLKIF